MLKHTIACTGTPLDDEDFEAFPQSTGTEGRPDSAPEVSPYRRRG